MTTSVLVALILLALCTAVAGRGSMAEAATAGRIDAGGSLTSGQQLLSSGGAFTLAMQADGNLVLSSRSGRAVWNSGTYGHPGASLWVQGDGNVVVYGPTWQALWSTRTSGRGGTVLVVQDDGNLVVYTASGTPVWDTGVPPPGSTGISEIPTTGPDRLAAGSTLSTGQQVLSANGNFALIMQGDGNLVVYTIQGTPVWDTGTTNNPGAYLAVQGDGNLVVYRAGTLQPLWASNMAAKGGVTLVLQNDSNLVQYSGAATPIWSSGTQVPYGSIDNPAPQATLKAGQLMSTGTQLTSLNGSYRAIMQSDGNFVVYAGTQPLWASNSAGWSTDRFAFQGDGNFVLYSANWTPLWSTNTHGSGAYLLIMGSDGDLRMFAPGGRVVWQTRGTPWPLLFPPGTSTPVASVSHYLRNLTGNLAGDASMTRAVGCGDATASPAGHRYLVVLHIGAQRSDVGGGWGVMLSATSRTITNAALVSALKAYIDGYAACMAGYSLLTLAIATNNDSSQYCGGDPNCNNPVPPAGVADPLGTAGGQVWAQQVINPLVTYAGGRQITVAGSNDVEPGFNGFVSQALAWTTAFLGATGAPYVFIGSADGCPYRALGQTGVCNWGWTQAQLYDLAFGLGAPGRMIPMPQIYNLNLAMQWTNISNVGVLAGKLPIAFGGALTEVVACQQSSPPCASMDSSAGWNALWSDLNALPATRILEMPYATDLRIN